MKTAVAKSPDEKALADLGRATLQIVHDLKNQLNGIKLYATFLRKRAERENHPPEDQEILAKLIAGLDRAARETTALVRFSKPIELRRRRTNLRNILVEAVGSRMTEATGLRVMGDFDPEVLTEAFRSLTEHLMGHLPPREHAQLNVKLHQPETEDAGEVLVEWNAPKLGMRGNSLGTFGEYTSIHAALAGKMIELHGGRIELLSDTVRVWLPLTKEK